MSRDPRYQKLLNTKRWRELRAWKMKQVDGFCEMCLAEGWHDLQAAAVDIHHRQPVESAKTEAEMERLCFDPNNLQALCVRHHIQVHAEAKSHTKEKVKENKARARERFMAMNDPNYKAENNEELQHRNVGGLPSQGERPT